MPTTPGVADEDLALLLRTHRSGLLVALGADGFQVPVPGAAELRGFRTIEVPAVRATIVDLVPPGDAMVVVATWEHARENGSAFGTVRLRSEPDRTRTLLIVDATAQHGVWLGVFSTVGAPVGAGVPRDAQPPEPLRPRLGTLRKNGTAFITGADERAVAMLGWPAERMVGARSLDFIHPDDHERAIRVWLEMLSHRRPTRTRMRHRRADGSWLWVEVENRVLEEAEPGEVLVETLLTDVTEEMAAYDEVHRREQLFRRLAESLPSGVLHVDGDRSVVYANARLTDTLGSVRGDGLADRLVALVEEDRTRLLAAIDLALDAGEDTDLEVEVRGLASREPRRCTASVVAVSGPDGANEALVSLHDVTDAARMREELRLQATYDALTGCLNRGSVIAMLEAALDPERDTLTGVVYIDLDEFKQLNDTFGHAAGDEMLVEVAERIGTVLRGGDQVGRLGGDEFLVVFPDLRDPDQILAIAERLRERLSGPVALSAGIVGMRSSIGAAIGSPGTAADDLVARADGAMYQSKQAHGGRVVLA